MRITLTPEQEKVVRERMDACGFQSAHEVIDDARGCLVEDDLERQAGADAVKAAIEGGSAQLRRGEGITITDKEAFTDGVMKRAKALLEARAA